MVFRRLFGQTDEERKPEDGAPQSGAPREDDQRGGRFPRLFGRTAQQEQQKQETALEKTRRRTLFSSLFERDTIDEELYEDLEAALIGSDVGVETTEML